MFDKVIAPSSAPAAADGALRALDWQELVARLAAARDMRALLARPASAGGSFASRAAAGCIAEGAGERGVNLGSLSGGKWTAATTVAAATRADHGDRDK